MSESIEQISNVLENVVLKFGINKQLAADISRAQQEQIKQSFGGDCLYIPKPAKNDRNKAVIAMFNGVNHDNILNEFNISKATLYRIIGNQAGFKAGKALS